MTQKLYVALLICETLISFSSYSTVHVATNYYYYFFLEKKRKRKELKTLKTTNMHLDSLHFFPFLKKKIYIFSKFFKIAARRVAIHHRPRDHRQSLYLSLSIFAPFDFYFLEPHRIRPRHLVSFF
jgi:hypothetical protein